jgi:hypothetical protein
MAHTRNKTKPTTGHKHTLPFYAQLYGLPFQTIRNAHKRKWPLDNPRRLFALMSDSPGPQPDLRELERVASMKTPTKRDRTPPPADPQKTAGPLTELKIGLVHEVKRLTEECARSFRDFQNEPSPVHRKSLQRIYQQNCATLAKLTPLAKQAEVEAGTLLSAQDVEATWMRTFSEIRSRLDVIGRRVASDALFSELDRVAVQEVVDREMDLALAQLSDSEPTQRERYTGPSNGRDPRWKKYHDLYDTFKTRHHGDDTQFTREEIAQLQALKRDE